jgi:hypothetical protein
MWSRRSFIMASCALVTCRVAEALALEFKKDVLEWLDQAITSALHPLMKHWITRYGSDRLENSN